MTINLAERAHNHNFEADWISRSLLDTDFYKLLMLQFIWKHFRAVQVTFALVNRMMTVPLAAAVPEAELRRQLEHARTRRVTKSELIWLAGNTFYGQRGIFESAFLEWLADFALPPYELNRDGDQWLFRVTADWGGASMWEIPALAILSELRTRAALAGLSEFELDILYARAKTKLWEKIVRLQGVPGLRLTDFGTRRRHSFLWQDYVVQAMAAELGHGYLGTSNALLAMRHDQEAMGTNAHELPMVLASLAVQGRVQIPIRQAQYEVLRLWQETYGGASASCSRIPSGRRSSCRRPPRGSATGRGSESTARTRSSPARSTWSGSTSAAKTPPRSSYSSVTASTWAPSSSCMRPSAGTSSPGTAPRTSRGPQTSATHRSGCPARASATHTAGAHSSRMTSVGATRGVSRRLTPSASSAR